MNTISPPDFYQLLSDETRLRCLILIYVKECLCVCELMHALSCSQPKVSRHLSMMRNAGIVTDERRGQWVYYSLNKKLPKWAQEIISAAYDNLKNIEPYVSDIKKIKLVKETCQ